MDFIVNHKILDCCLMEIMNLNNIFMCSGFSEKCFKIRSVLVGCIRKLLVDWKNLSTLILVLSHPRKKWSRSPTSPESHMHRGLSLRPILCRYSGVIEWPNRKRIIWTIRPLNKEQESNQGLRGIFGNILKRCLP